MLFPNISQDENNCLIPHLQHFYSDSIRLNEIPFLALDAQTQFSSVASFLQKEYISLLKKWKKMTVTYSFLFQKKNMPPSSLPLYDTHKKTPVLVLMSLLIFSCCFPCFTQVTLILLLPPFCRNLSILKIRLHTR